MQGYTTSQIARTLRKDFKTIQRDIDAIETQWQVDRAPILPNAVARHMQTLREVMRQAWIMFHTSKDSSTNKAAALNTIIQADKELQELDGVSKPDRINAAALADIMDTLTDTLLEVGGPGTHQLFLQRLRNRANGVTAMSQLAAIVGAGNTTASTQMATVDALTVDAEVAQETE